MTPERIDWSGGVPALTCSECGDGFNVSERNMRDWLRSRRQGSPVCGLCRERRAVGPPGPEEHRWLESLPDERRDDLLRQASMLRT